MDKNVLSGKDLLLALLYCAGKNDTTNEPIIGRTKLTKTIFLFEKEIQKDFFADITIKLPNFEAYNYGPFSKELFDDLSFFLSIGFIHAEETLIPISVASIAEKKEIEISLDDYWGEACFDDIEDEKYELQYSLSPQGIKYVEDNIWPHFSTLQKQNLQKFKRQINTISLDSLLRYVYNKYPEYTDKSLIVDKYLSKGTR